MAMKKAIDTEDYSTRDLSEASFLYASGIKLIRLNKDNDRFWFVFEDKNLCGQLTDSFWRKEASVNAKEYADALRTMKDLIFNQDRR